MSRPRLPYRPLSAARGSHPLSIDFPISPRTWGWLFCHTCTSFTIAHISSTHTLTHCEVLICPGYHLWAFSLSIVCFLVLTPASFLDPLILCWLPRLGLFLHGLWYLPPALTTLPVSLTTSLLCPLCSYCWWLTRSCLIILIKLQMDPTPSDVSSQKTSPNSDPAALRQLSTELTAQASQLAVHQQQLQRLTALTEQLVTALQGVHVTQPQAAASSPPAPAMQAPPISPRLAFPEKFDGDPTRCKGFLLQCSLFVNQQPALYPAESGRIAFVCSLLTGKALDWATVIWGTDGSAFPTFDSFIHHFREVFDHPAEGRGAGEQLLALSQGRRTAAEYALTFRTLAAQTTWVEDTLKLLFRKGLSAELQSELACRDERSTLGQFIELTIHLDNLIRSRCTARSSPCPRSPPRSQYATEPMQLGFTPQERERRMQNQLCLYCGQAGHMRNTCPVRPSSDQRPGEWQYPRIQFSFQHYSACQNHCS